MVLWLAAIRVKAKRATHTHCTTVDRFVSLERMVTTSNPETNLPAY
jgi:hypothetical protein